jgi:hypothetical protein
LLARSYLRMLIRYNELGKTALLEGFSDQFPSPDFHVPVDVSNLCLDDAHVGQLESGSFDDLVRQSLLFFVGANGGEDGFGSGASSKVEV